MLSRLHCTFVKTSEKMEEIYMIVRTQGNAFHLLACDGAVN